MQHSLVPRPYPLGLWHLADARCAARELWRCEGCPWFCSPECTAPTDKIVLRNRRAAAPYGRPRSSFFLLTPRYPTGERQRRRADPNCRLRKRSVSTKVVAEWQPDFVAHGVELKLVWSPRHVVTNERSWRRCRWGRPCPGLTLAL